jgi:PAS domain S-box-containing protein
LKAEENLNRSNQRYEYATLATSDVIWEANFQNGTHQLSKNFELLFGHCLSSAPQLIDDNLWLQNVHPEDVDRVLNQAAENIAAGNNDKWDKEYRFKKADGSYAIVYDRTIAVRNEEGNVISLIGAMQDITIKKAEEERLKLLETVVTQTTDAIIITSTAPIGQSDLPIIYVNEAFTKITGYSLDEIKNKTPRILQGALTDKNELAKVHEAIKNWLPCEIEVINYRKDGTPFWSNISTK